MWLELQVKVLVICNSFLMCRTKYLKNKRRQSSPTRHSNRTPHHEASPLSLSRAPRQLPLPSPAGAPTDDVWPDVSNEWVFRESLPKLQPPHIYTAPSPCYASTTSSCIRCANRSVILSISFLLSVCLSLFGAFWISCPIHTKRKELQFSWSINSYGYLNSCSREI